MKRKKILGLILELNPPHHGHKYFIDKAKELTNPDYVIAVISSNFSMRGDIMVLDKFTKTKIAMEMGIDLIIELPTIASLASADYFGYNSVKLLSEFNVTDIVFGAEIDDICKLNKLTEIINNSSYNRSIKDYLQKGYSYSTASNKALGEYTTDPYLIEQFSMPNNTLAIQYINAINKINTEIKYNIIKRIDNNYFEENTTGKISSATSIRNLLKENKDYSEFVYSINSNYIDLKSSTERLFNIIKYKLLLSPIDELKLILGVSEGIESRLVSCIKDANSYDEYLTSVVTKRYTVNKIKRILINIILGIKEKTNMCYNNKDFLIRVLGFNEKGRKLISSLPKDIKNRIITSLKNVHNIYDIELKSTMLYSIITNNTQLYIQEYNIPIRSEKNDN